MGYYFLCGIECNTGSSWCTDPLLHQHRYRWPVAQDSGPEPVCGVRPPCPGSMCVHLRASPAHQNMTWCHYQMPGSRWRGVRHPPLAGSTEQAASYPKSWGRDMVGNLVSLLWNRICIYNMVHDRSLSCFTASSGEFHESFNERRRVKREQEGRVGNERRSHWSKFPEVLNQVCGINTLLKASG